MTADLEQHGDVVSMAFAGERRDIWHGLGNGLDGLMTLDQAIEAAHMDRQVRIRPIETPEGVEWATPQYYQVILEGKVLGVNADGTFAEIPPKVVGVCMQGGAEAHLDFTIRDRFEIAEAAIFASQGEAVWSTAGLIRNGRQGFATMEAPPVIIDPDGIADIIRSYVGLGWSWDGTMSTQLGASHVRQVCANTVAMHLKDAQPILKVRHTSPSAKERLELGAHSWAMAQNRSAALKLKAEKMLAVANGKRALDRIAAHFNPKPDADASKRAVSLQKRRAATIEALWFAETNSLAVGDNGWAAYNTFVEYLDWYKDVQVPEGTTEEEARHLLQFDGSNDQAKSIAAELVLAV